MERCSQHPKDEIRPSWLPSVLPIVLSVLPPYPSVVLPCPSVLPSCHSGLPPALLLCSLCTLWYSLYVICAPLCPSVPSMSFVPFYVSLVSPLCSSHAPHQVSRCSPHQGSERSEQKSEASCEKSLTLPTAADLFSIDRDSKVTDSRIGRGGPKKCPGHRLSDCDFLF